MPEDPNISIKEFSIASEIIFGVMILMVLKFKFQEKSSKEETDKLINKLWLSGPLVNQYFIFNSISKKYHDLKLSNLIEVIPKFTIKDNLLPKLEFDPEYQKLLVNDAIKQLYDTNFISGWANSKDHKQYKFMPDRGVFFKNIKISRDRKTKIFNIDSNLSISKFDFRSLNILPYSFFSSSALINEIIRVFIEYYSTKLPKRKNEISEILSCFGEMLKIAEGNLFKKFRYGQLMKKLSVLTSKKKANQFLKKFCLIQTIFEFPNKLETFKPRKFIVDYHNFLSFAAYRISGFVFTGTFLIWRAMIKYLESLQNEEDFWIQKGPLLENWCYNKAIELGFKPEKVILRNQKMAPSEIYYKMKEQIKAFPKPALEFEVEFPPDYKVTFHEIDIAIRIEEYIFIFECKSTSTPIGESGDYIRWMDKFGTNIHLLMNKGEILLHNIDNGTINHPYFKGLNHFIPTIIQTEGIFSKLLGLDTSGYIHFLGVLKENIDNNTIKEYLKENFKNPKNSQGE